VSAQVCSFECDAHHFRLLQVLLLQTIRQLLFTHWGFTVSVVCMW